LYLLEWNSLPEERIWNCIELESLGNGGAGGSGGCNWSGVSLDFWFGDSNNGLVLTFGWLLSNRSLRKKCQLFNLVSKAHMLYCTL
jgi:hypothetical protein